MGDNNAAELITLSCENHHERLTTGLWRFFQSQRRTDWDVLWAGRSIRAHRLLLEVFMSPDKLIESAASMQRSRPEYINGTEIDAMLEFLYQGTVTVHQDHLASLLHIAKKAGFQMMVDVLKEVTKNLVIKPLPKKPHNVARKAAIPAKIVAVQLVHVTGQEGDNLMEGHVVFEQDGVDQGIAHTMEIELPAEPESSDSDSSVEPVKPGQKNAKKKKKYICEVCQKAFSMSSNLTYHMRIHTGEKPYKCLACDQAFARSDSLRAHARLHDQDSLFRCEECGRAFTRKQAFNNHKLIHNPEKAFECSACGRKFSQKFAFKLHLTLHTGEGRHKCENCGKTFVTASVARKHARTTCQAATHLKEKLYECDECGKWYATPECLKTHKYTHKQTQKRVIGAAKLHQCNTCQKSFFDASRLNQHIRVHTGEKPFPCDVCTKPFSTKTALVKHQRVHTGIRPYQCDECEKCYGDQQSLAIHKRTHTGEKPYACSVAGCEKKFATYQSLNSHNLTHTGIKPFQCEFCDRAFTARHNLKAHRKTHIMTS